MPRKSPLPKRELEIGQRLRQAREARKIQRTALARRIGISSEGLAGYEGGRNPLPRKYGEKICRLLDINQFWLLHGKSNRFGRIPFDPKTQKLLAESKLFSEAYERIWESDSSDHYNKLSKALEWWDGNSFDPKAIDADLEENKAWNAAIDALKHAASDFSQDKRISYFMAMSVEAHRTASRFSKKYDDQHFAESD